MAVTPSIICFCCNIYQSALKIHYSEGQDSNLAAPTLYGTKVSWTKPKPTVVKSPVLASTPGTYVVSGTNRPHHSSGVCNMDLLFIT
jgi:hypothetical protein